jgi:hypothetical protein
MKLSRLIGSVDKYDLCADDLIEICTANQTLYFDPYLLFRSIKRYRPYWSRVRPVEDVNNVYGEPAVIYRSKDNEFKAIEAAMSVDQIDRLINSNLRKNEFAAIYRCLGEHVNRYVIFSDKISKQG